MEAGAERIFGAPVVEIWGRAIGGLGALSWAPARGARTERILFAGGLGVGAAKWQLLYFAIWAILSKGMVLASFSTLSSLASLSLNEMSVF